MLAESLSSSEAMKIEKELKASIDMVITGSESIEMDWVFKVFWDSPCFCMIENDLEHAIQKFGSHELGSICCELWSVGNRRNLDSTHDLHYHPFLSPVVKFLCSFQIEDDAAIGGWLP